jgi:hypothetical protein
LQLWAETGYSRIGNEDGEVRTMAGKETMDKLSIYIPQRKMDEEPVARLIQLGQSRDRSVNYLVVEAIIQYLDREENKS